MRPWMIVAEPLDLGNDVAASAAEVWNSIWVRERLNRYWSRRSAQEAIPLHEQVWGQWIRFHVVRRKTFWQGWR
jgi:hypothetical protein